MQSQVYKTSILFFIFIAVFCIFGFLPKVVGATTTIPSTYNATTDEWTVTNCSSVLADMEHWHKWWQDYDAAGNNSTNCASFQPLDRAFFDNELAGYEGAISASSTLPFKWSICFYDQPYSGGYQGNLIGCAYMYWNGNSWYADDARTDTRIVNISPANNAYLATTSSRSLFTNTGAPIVRGGATSSLSVSWYVNEADLGYIQSIDVNIKHIDQNYLYLIDQVSTYTFSEIIAPVAGDGLWTDEIWLPEGNYEISASITSSYLLGLIPGYFDHASNAIAASQDDSNPLAQYHQYSIGNETTIGKLRQDAQNALENILSGTTTASVADCNVLSGFDFGDCITFALVPSKKQMQDFGTVVSQNIFSKFPLGYAWNFYQILLSTSTAALPVINATIPNGVAGAGAHIDLAITPNTLAYIWNATTSQFTNESAPDTRTFFQIVSGYWNVIVYLALGMYLLGRVLGSHVVGRLWTEETTYGANDFQRVKEKLMYPKDVRNVKITDYHDITDDNYQDLKRNRLL